MQHLSCHRANVWLSALLISTVVISCITYFLASRSLLVGVIFGALWLTASVLDKHNARRFMQGKCINVFIMAIVGVWRLLTACIHESWSSHPHKECAGDYSVTKTRHSKVTEIVWVNKVHILDAKRNFKTWQVNTEDNEMFTICCTYDWPCRPPFYTSWRQHLPKS